LALISVALGEAARDQRRWLFRIILIITFGLPGQENMCRIVEVIVPLRSKKFHLTVLPRVQRGKISVIFGNQMAGAIGKFAPHLFSQLQKQPVFRRITDLVYRIKSQSVEIVLVQPEAGVVEEELAHRNSVISNRGTPWRVAILVEKLRSKCRKIVPLWSKVVVDDVKQDHQSLTVRRIDQLLQFRG